MTTESLVPSLHPLDKNFVGPKPIEEAPLSVFRELEADDNLIKQRKRNGHGSYLTFDGSKNGVHIYSRGINQLTQKLPAIVDGLYSYDVPRGTMLVGELFVDVKGFDDLGKFGAIARSGVDRAVMLQQGNPVQLRVFNIVMHKGKPVIHYPYQDRLDILQELFAKNASPVAGVIEPLEMSFDDACEEVKKLKWEGLVLYSKDGTSTFRMDGAQELPPRPTGCWKWKPYHEGDFVATGWIPSTSNKFKGQVKDLLISQYDPVTRKLVSWGKVGVGLTSAQRKEFANDALYPMVFEVKFECRTPNTRLISARILRRRIDKKPTECYSPVVS